MTYTPVALLRAVCATAMLSVPAAGLWLEQEGAVGALQPVSFTVALHPRQGSQSEVTELLNAVSDPESLRYGEYLTPADLRALTSTPAHIAALVIKELQPCTCTNPAGSALTCTGDAGTAERVLGTKLARFVHSKTGATAYKVGAGGGIRLSSAIKPHVAFVSGINQLIEPRQRHRTEMVGGDPSPTVVPETIRKLYNVTIRGDASIIQSAGEFPGNWHQNGSDLATFGANNGLGNLSITRHAGQPDDPEQEVSGETTLDVQYVAGVGLSNTNWLWNSDHWIFEMTQALQNASADARPSVMSLSYGWSEAQQCGSVVSADCKKYGFSNAEYINRTNFELQKVGLLGITMTASSGDSGCHGRTDKVCLLNAKMHPAFPAASPFITAVGGTQLDVKNHPVDTANSTTPICEGKGVLAGRCAMGGYEIVSSTQTKSRITSGGGFSSENDRPSYQDAAVGGYLKQINLNPRLYNQGGRGYPDIAALAHRYYIEINGQTGEEDGTSASSPVIAGLMGLLNAHRKRAGRPNLGFANPLLYHIHAVTNGTAFNDIVDGSNRCTEGGCWCQTGFDAKPGWDASTGLGTPNFGRILAAMDEIDARRERAQAKAKAQARV